MSDEQKVSVIMPAYNESLAIGDVLDKLLSIAQTQSWEVIVIDDGSEDGTGKIASQYPVHLLQHPINLGQGASLATGIEYALRIKSDYIVTFDSDGQMSPEDIVPMLEKLKKENLDIVLGSRFLGLESEGMPASKKVTLKLAVIFTRLTTGLKLTDVHNGLRVMTSHAASKIEINQNRMAHASEILSEIARNKLKYIEVPVNIKYTEYSKAKGQSLSNALNILFELFMRTKK